MDEQSGTGQAGQERPDPTVLRTRSDDRLKLTLETRQALRRLDRVSLRSGRLSPRAYNLTISHERRFIWFRVAKVGTRTILGHLEANDVALDVHHGMRLRYPVEAMGDYYRFAFVREPLARFVSAWQDKVVDHNYYRFEPDVLARMQRLEAFAEWTATLDLSDVTTCDQHLVLQTRAIDLTQVDQLGRMESFAADFAAVCRRLELPEVVARSHNVSGARSVSGTPPDVSPGASSEVSPEVREQVAEIYRLDFQVLGYPLG